jgi:XTP/dITP diphosphohydrolase
VIPDCVVLATANPGKVSELRGLVGEWGPIEVRSLADFPGVSLPEETGTTYVENAAAKARAAALATGLPALADDSGLEVDALGGAPGVRSARFAESDAARIRRLLTALVGALDRRARFRCVVVLAWPDGREDDAEGVVEGRIALAEAGERGFGYDPIFVAGELGVTFAAATAADKARVSHRARAVRALGAKLGARTLRGPAGPC